MILEIFINRQNDVMKLHQYDVIKLQVCFCKTLAEPLLGPPKFYSNRRACLQHADLLLYD